MSSQPTHLSAVLPTRTPGSLTITTRPTPTPGPGEVLISVHSFALNPIDYHQRDSSFAITTYPAIPGSDVAGTILAHGANVPDGTPEVGSRVLAFAPCFFARGAPDYGGLQEKVLVFASCVTRLPEGMGYNDAAKVPMAVMTAWNGWYVMGLGIDSKFEAAEKQGLLIWGGASSVGTAVIQLARMTGFRTYVVASGRHHGYLRTLGAERLFDYKSEGVVQEIVDSVKADDVKLRYAYDAVGAMQQVLDVLKPFITPGETTRFAEAVPFGPEAPKVEGVDMRFVLAPEDVEERKTFFTRIFNVWLKEKLTSGEFVPAPATKVLDGGLYAIDKGLDELKSGVSGTKLVLEFQK